LGLDKIYEGIYRPADFSDHSDVVSHRFGVKIVISANGAFFSGTYSTEVAMETVYGSYDSASRSSVWTPEAQPGL
jgi:hypothetical protein